MIRFAPVASLSVVLLISGALLGCSQKSDVESEWTVEEGALTLERDLLVGDDQDFYFGRIGDVAVDSEGRIYAADREAQHVKVIGPSGALETTIGGPGEGPGEFRLPRALALARGDSLYVFGLRTLSVFSPETRAFVRRVEIQMPPRHGFYSMYVPEKSGSLLMAFHPWWGSTDPIGLYRVDPQGVPADSPFVEMPPEQWVARMKGGVPGPASRVPFGRRPAIALGPEGRIYQGYSDSLTINVYSMNGTRQKRWTLPFEPVPVPDSTIEQRLASAGDIIRGLLEDTGIPETKPAFEDFFTDAQGRVWIKRPTAEPDRAAWWVADPEVKRVATARLPADVDLAAVRGGRAYGAAETEAGAPVVVRYRVNVQK